MDFFDLHCDTPTECYDKNQAFSINNLAVSDKNGSCFDKWYQCFAIWIDDKCDVPFDYYKKVLNNFKGKLNESQNSVVPVFTVENGKLLGSNAERIYELNNDGIKALTLTWNGENQIASGAHASGGLKPFGKQVIKYLNECKIATDLSHLNKESFFDAIELALYPIATHSCCDSVFSHIRNLNDEQIELIVQKNSIIGLCLYPNFLGEGDVFLNVYKHLYHLLDKGYENHIAIGSDFDGADMSAELSDISKIPVLYKKMLNYGIDEKILQKIFFKNAYDFFFRL